MTPAQFKNMIVDKLYQKRRKELTFGEWAGVVQGLDGADKQQLIQTFQRGRGGVGGDFLQKRVDEKIRADALVEADQILSDATLTQDEFLRIFGND